MKDMVDAIITNDKDLVKKMIFGGTEEKAVELCREICKYNIYDGWSGFGLYLYRARLDEKENPEKLSKSLEAMFNGQKEETHHVWIVLQEVMRFLAGEASEDFKKKVGV